MKSVGIYTLGCKVNTYESLYIKEQLEKNNYIIKDFEEVCDIYIINTCTVTNTSDIKSRKIIRQAVKKNKDACIVAMGCFIESHQDYEEEGVDIYLGTKDKTKIISLLDEYFERIETIRKLDKNIQEKFEDMHITNFKGRTRAFVKIQDGCENFCSYCIIPYVRGKCRSKALKTVLEEITALVKNGYKEIVLTGIHTGNYGVDINTNFANLLKEIIKIEGLERLRISSIEITELNKEVLDVLKNSPIIVEHLHIPLQAGSDHILKLMNRKYDLAYFKDKIKQIRKIRKDISISTDIIVGHPEESEEDFNETVKTAKELEFSKIHVFPYSLRTGTKSAEMKQIPGNIKKERARKLLEVSHDLEKKYMQKFIDQKVVILTENNKNGYTYGHTGNYLHIKIKGHYESDKMLKIKLTKIEYPYMIGEIDD